VRLRLELAAVQLAADAGVAQGVAAGLEQDRPMAAQPDTERAKQEGVPSHLLTAPFCEELGVADGFAAQLIRHGNSQCFDFLKGGFGLGHGLDDGSPPGAVGKVDIHRNNLIHKKITHGIQSCFN
jgi:hypothetical protein